MPRENGEKIKTRSQKSENNRQLWNSPSETVPTSIEKKKNKLSDMDVDTTLLEIQKQLTNMSIAIDALPRLMFFCHDGPTAHLMTRQSLNPHWLRLEIKIRAFQKGSHGSILNFLILN